MMVRVTRVGRARATERIGPARRLTAAGTVSWPSTFGVLSDAEYGSDKVFLPSQMGSCRRTGSRYGGDHVVYHDGGYGSCIVRCIGKAAYECTRTGA